MSYEAAQMRFVERLESIRAAKGLTKKNFGKLIGVSGFTYDYYVNKGGMPNLYTAMVMAERLGLTLDQLLGITGGKKA